jgi:tetrahydromethanopterin S-methyltransferase subunit B|tara:strand:- start:1509 stop:1955 length:447 start_codon:yes stop_codon:yes gene_type:complete
MARSNTTRRSAILEAMAELFEKIDGGDGYKQDLTGAIEPRMKFWDEVESFPCLHMSAGTETREYYGGGQKWRFLTVTIRIYVNADDPIQELEELLEDVETVLDDAGQFDYSTTTGTQQVTQVTIISISTDEGALQPLGVGEMIVEIRY